MQITYHCDKRGLRLQIMHTSYLLFFLHKCIFWAQFFSKWRRVTCGKISQNFPKFLKNFPKCLQKPKISPHDNFFSTNIIRDIRDKYQVCPYFCLFVVISWILFGLFGKTDKQAARSCAITSGLWKKGFCFTRKKWK